jgi:hypothetical protein
MSISLTFDLSTEHLSVAVVVDIVDIGSSLLGGLFEEDNLWRKHQVLQHEASFSDLFGIFLGAMQRVYHQHAGRQEGHSVAWRHSIPHWP